MNPSQRVAARFLEAQSATRIAGVFEPPPKMAEDISRWMLAVYCGHVLAQIDLRRATLQDAITPIRQALADMQESQNGLLKRLENLKPGEELRISRGFLGMIGAQASKDTYYDGKSFNHPWLESGKKMEIPPGGEPAVVFAKGTNRLSYKGPLQRPNTVYWRMMEDLNESLFVATNVLLHLERAPRNPSDSEASLQNLLEMEKLCLQYTTSRKAYKSNTSRVFPVDLTGWKYAQKASAESIRNLSSTPWSKGVTCTLHFVKHKKSNGTWLSSRRELDVDAGQTNPSSLEALEIQISEIRRTLYHETRHMGQDLLTALLGLKENAGLPSKSIRYPEPEPKTRSTFDPRTRSFVTEKVPPKEKEHALRDIEFQTRLGDEITRFSRYWKTQKDSGISLRQAVATWISEKEFFTMLKKHEPLKWKKAVSEFFKAVSSV